MDNTPEDSPACKRRKSGWLWLAVFPLFAFAVLADLRACIDAHGTPPAGMDAASGGKSAFITVLLFQWRPRGTACKRRERLVREAASHLPSVEVRTVHLGDPANRHFILEFGIQTETVVLYDGERCVVLDDCQPPGQDEVAFKARIAGSIADFAAAKQQMAGSAIE